MEYVIIAFVLVCLLIPFLKRWRYMRLLRSVTSPDRGTGSEHRLIVRMLKRGVHPKAIFHDLYVERSNGEFAQIDIVVATPQGLLAIEVKEYGGLLFGDEYQRYWTQILNFGKEKYRFYNPIMQNAGHIRALREQSEQFAGLPIFNIVLFAGNCSLRNIRYMSEDMFVGYVSDIKYLLKRIRKAPLAEYTDKREVARLLHRAVANGDDPEIVASHISSVRRKSAGKPRPTFTWQFGIFRISVRGRERRKF